MTWTSVKDKLPIKGERVIFYVDGGFAGEGYIDIHKTWYRMSGYEVESTLGEVIAWMPMPEYKEDEG